MSRLIARLCARPDCVRPFKSNLSVKKFCSVHCRLIMNSRRARKNNSKSCNRSVQNWNARNPDKAKAARIRHKDKVDAIPEWRALRLRAYRNSFYQKKYGITLEQKEQRIVAQEFQCANPGCRTKHPGKKGFVTDHSHISDILRGELCTRCNVALGMAQDSCAVLEGLVRYLKFYE